jgi:hypothetical protein
MTGGPLDRGPFTPKDLRRISQAYGVANLRQSIQIDVAYDFKLPIPHQEPDSIRADRVIVSCSR